MARPQKRGLDYFTMDVDFFSDIKIRKLIKRHQCSAIVVYQYLLCQIYSEGYYLTYDEDTAFIVSESIHLDEDEIESVIKSCLQLGLFDQSMFDEYSILTSRSIQDRYFEASKRRVPRAGMKYIIADEDDFEEGEESVNSAETKVIAAETRVSVTETAVSATETPINVAESTQRKEKKSKVKENVADATQKKVSVNNNYNNNSTKSFDFEKAYAEMENDVGWQAEISKRTHANGKEVARRLDEFRTHCLVMAKRQHIDADDMRRHFVSWLDIQLTQENNTQKTQSDENHKVDKYRFSRGFEPSVGQTKVFNVAF
jgi:hypothetical protein